MKILLFVILSIVCVFAIETILINVYKSANILTHIYSAIALTGWFFALFWCFRKLPH